MGMPQVYYPGRRAQMAVGEQLILNTVGAAQQIIFNFYGLIQVDVYAHGGNGAHVSGGTNAAVGGGGAGFARKLAFLVSVGLVVPVQISAGAAGAGVGNGTFFMDINTVAASGGTNATGGGSSNPGTGGAGFAGDLLVNGQNGGGGGSPVSPGGSAAGPAGLGTGFAGVGVSGGNGLLFGAGGGATDTTNYLGAQGGIVLTRVQ